MVKFYMPNILLTNKPHSEFPHSRRRSFQDLSIKVKLKSLQSVFDSDISANDTITSYIYKSYV